MREMSMRTCVIYLAIFSVLLMSANGHATCSLKRNSFYSKFSKTKKLLAQNMTLRTSLTPAGASQAAGGQGATGAYQDQSTSAAIATHAQTCANERNRALEAITKFKTSCGTKYPQDVQKANQDWQTWHNENTENISSLCSVAGAANYNSTAGAMGQVAGYGEAVQKSSGGSGVGNAVKKWGPTVLVGAGVGLLAHSLLDDDDKKRQPAQQEDNSTDVDVDNDNTVNVYDDDPTDAPPQISPVADAPTENSQESIAAASDPTEFDPINTGVAANEEGDQSGQRDMSISSNTTTAECLSSGVSASANCIGNLVVSDQASAAATMVAEQDTSNTSSDIASDEVIEGSNRGLASSSNLSAAQKAFFEKHGFYRSQVPQHCESSDLQKMVACTKKHLQK